MMFSATQLLLLGEAVELKIASLKRGSNTSRSPQFKALFDQQLLEYNALLAHVKKEPAGVEVSQEDVSKRK